MQAVNLNRNLVEGIRQRELQTCLLFTGPRPDSLDELSFNPYDFKEATEAAACTLTLSSVFDIKTSGNRPTGLSPISSTIRESFTKENFVDATYDSENGTTVKYTVPGFSHTYSRTYGNVFSWRSNRAVLGRFNSLSGTSFDVGTTNAQCAVQWGTEKLISGFRMAQVLDRAEVSNNVFRNSFATTLRVWNYVPDPNDSSQLITELIGDFSGIGVGVNEREFAEPILSHGLLFRATAGTGSNAPGVSSGRAPRAQWRVQGIVAYVNVSDGGTIGQSISPTWGLVYNFTASSSGNNNYVGSQFFDYGKSQFNQHPIVLFDVGPPGSNSTCELIQYPIEPGVSPQVHKFDLNISN